MDQVKYPLDTASFKWIRQNNYLYIDKTIFINALISSGKFYFLARPRRFGKSLLLDTLAEYFKGTRQLFKGLEIDRLQTDPWDTFPVISFNLSGAIYDNPEALINSLSYTLEKYEKIYGIAKSDRPVEIRFQQLIEHVHNKTKKNIVVLVDEYDAPLSSAVDKPELQDKYKEQLHGFYSVLKQCDNIIRFCMLAGVTRYGKVSVFSGLNNLHDITFSDEYAAICGITEEELRKNYNDGILKLAKRYNKSNEQAIEILKFHYDGYHFSEKMIDIYNPFSINYALYNSKIEDYWCESGVPTILSKSLMKNDFDVEKLNGIKVPKSELKNLSIYEMEPVPLFYQTGYLTIKNYDERKDRYTLGFPNREVESGILRNILNVYIPEKGEKQRIIYDMEDALEEGKPKQFIETLKSFLSGIPSKLHAYVAKYENYYHTIFYCMTTLIGLDVEAEYNTSEGFIDILIKTSHYIYIIELKMNGNAISAIKQIEDKHYGDPFNSDPRQLFKIGLGFSKEKHSITSDIIC